MAKRTEQLNFLTPEPAQGQIIPTALHTEMQRSYLEYAMSVIVGRALPDIRDGLKPVHRRILFAMHELGLVPDRPYRKCARVVGDVLGKYHPHGDQSVYDALVRLVQDFSCRYPLLAGHGNFGSVDNDPPAAMRYTECRLAPIGNEALLSDIDEAIIDFTDNFDGSQQEPTVLPAQLPMLLLNGASGIAVGMATNIPPHNLREVVDAAIALIDQPDLPDEKLFELIPAPDFPTGGIIIGDAGIKEAYTTGRGSITLRGVATPEIIPGGKSRKSRPSLVVTELPFQVNKAAWIEKVAELVNQNRLDGIADLRDESDRTGMRVVIELKKEANPQVLLEGLYKQTALQINFGTIMLALVGSQPREMSLREMLVEFLNFREATLTRRFNHELNRSQQRLHLVEGLVTVLDNLDALINLLRFAADSSAAKEALQSQFSLSTTQAEAILSMPLRRITGLERQNLQTEVNDLQVQIDNLELLLHNRRELLKVLKRDLRQLKKKHGDDRRTRIATHHGDPNNNGVDKGASKGVNKATSTTTADLPTSDSELNLNLELEIEDTETLLQLTQKGYVKRADINSRTGKAPSSAATDDPADPSVGHYLTRVSHDLIVLTDSGKAFPVAIKDIPPTSARGKNRGTPLITLLPDSVEASEDAIVAHFTWDRNAETQDTLVLLTAQGKIKRSPLTEFAGINNRGLIAARLKDEDKLFWAGIVAANKQLAIATSSGRILRMPADDEQIPPMSRGAMGNQAIRLRQSEQLVGIDILDLNANFNTELVVVTAKGFAKRIAAHHLRLSPRGAIGSQAIAFKTKDDYLAAFIALTPAQTQLNMYVGRSPEDTSPKIIEFPLEHIPLQACNTMGQLIVKMIATERVMQLGVV